MSTLLDESAQSVANHKRQCCIVATRYLFQGRSLTGAEGDGEPGLARCRIVGEHAYLFPDVSGIIMMSEDGIVNGQGFVRSSVMRCNEENGDRCPVLTRVGCPSGLSFATLDIWQSPTDSCSTHSAGRRSSIRRRWRAFLARPTRPSTVR